VGGGRGKRERGGLATNPFKFTSDTLSVIMALTGLRKGWPWVGGGEEEVKEKGEFTFWHQQNGFRINFSLSGKGGGERRLRKKEGL